MLSSNFSDGEDTPGGEGATEPPPPPGGDEEYPGGEGPANAQPTQQADDANQPPADGQPAPDTSPIPGWKANPDGTYTVPATELPRVQSALKFSEAVSQFFTTPQEAQSAYSTSSQMRQLQNDWAYGTDQSVQSVLQFLAGEFHPDPSGRATFSRSFGKMLSLAPDYLQRANPQAYQSLVQSFGTRLADSLYQRASQLATQYGPDNQIVKDALQEAQAVEWGLSGGRNYRTDLPKSDPQAQARAEFEHRQQEFNTRQEAALRRDVAAFNNSAVEGAKLTQLDQAIAAKLVPVKDRFPEVAFNDLVAGIHGEVMRTLEQSNSDWYTEHRQNFDSLINDFRTTWQQGSPGNGLQPRIASYISDFMSRANRVLGPIAQKRINAATQARVASANTRNRTNTGQFTAPTAANSGNGANAGRPRPNSPAAGQNGQPESRSDKFDREWSAVFAPFRG